MINGIGYPKFYIYDSTGVTLQTIPTNLGTSGVISLTKRVIVNEKQPDRYDIVNESPYTRTELREFLGFKYKCSLTVVQEDYLQGLLQYSADQATTKVTDIYKLKAIEAYANAGYKIKFTPHNDLEDLWGSQFPIWVDVKITRTGKSQRIYSDSFSMEVHGTTLLDSPYPFTAFSFETSGGVANTAQCLNLNGTSQKGTFTATNIGTVHSLEFWAKKAITNAFEPIISDGATMIGFVLSNTTLRYDLGGGDFVAKGVGTISNSDRHHYVVTRSGATVEIWMDAVSLGSGSLSGASTAITPDKFGWISSTYYFSEKIRAVRCYTAVITSAQIARQYNNGYGNWPLDIPAYFIWEFDGTGGLETPATDEDDQYSTKDITLAASPTRTSF